MGNDFDVCIYHFPCADGFMAAAIVELAIPGIELVPVNYNKPIPLDKLRGKSVLSVDFCPKPDTILNLCQREVKHLTIWDHHLSAYREVEKSKEVGLLENLTTVFRMDHSGAALAWLNLMSDSLPVAVQHVEDRDLWRFKLPGTRAFQACLFSWPYDLRLWQKTLGLKLDSVDYHEMLREGEAIERKHLKDCLEFIDKLSHKLSILGHLVPACNVPYTHVSEVGHQLLKQYPGAPFAVSYYTNSNGLIELSFRSEDDRVDVSKVAQVFGGGGHRNASGCQVHVDQLVTMLA